MTVRILIVLMSAMLSACAPTVLLPGPAVVPPALTDDALIAVDGARLPLSVWAPEATPKAVVVAVHGFNDYRTFIEPFAAWAAAKGVVTYAYDQRGFGGAPDPGYWHGRQALADDLSTMVALLRDRHPGLPVFVLGESMGGAVSIVTRLRNDLKVEGYILSAPALWGWAQMPWYQRWATILSAYTVPGMKLTGEGLNIRASDNDEALIRLSRDPLVIKRTRVDAIYGLVWLMDEAYRGTDRFDGPTLVLYGGNDQVVPAPSVADALSRLPDRASGHQRIAFYPKAYHLLMRDLDAATVWADILAWIDDQAAALPSGADLGGIERLAAKQED